ncbi:transmembrane and coiled-coil domain-containing protein 6 isoform X3 [Mobula birostris]|uniref:transmembrane and coiled-coil domain-containing protein 6 isoform X3 n=1 Tax=Mobula birostris TaxID=1983395 RepID=UPI003B27C924
MWRGSGAPAVDEIKARRRQQEWVLRKARREKQLVSKRLLRELQRDGEEMEIREPLVTQEEVSQLYQRIQRGSEDRVTALRSLCQFLHHTEAQKMFVSLENSIHVLIGLFTSNLASVQLEAARCLLKLSHASDPSISLVCLPATPYLLTYLSGQSAKFTCGSGSQLDSTFDPPVGSGFGIWDANGCGVRLVSALHRDGVNCECLVSQGLVHQAVRLLIVLGNAIDSSTTTDGVELLIYPVARCLGNLTASCESVLSRDRLLDCQVLQALRSIIDKFLQSHPSLTRECLWLLNNLTAADDQLCSAIFSLDLVPMVLQLMLFSGGINTLVLILLGNIVEKGPAHCDKLQQHKELFPALCSTLRAADAEVVRLSLEVLNLIFSHCVQAIAEFVNQNGIPALEAIHYNNNEEIRVRANFLMDRYFTDKAV